MMYRVFLLAIICLFSQTSQAAYFVNLPASPNSTGNFTLSWNAELTDAGGYYLYQTVSGTTTTIYSGSARTKTLSGLSSGTYTYELRGLTTSWIGGEPVIRNVSMDTYSIVVNSVSVPPKMSTPSVPSSSDWSIPVSWSQSSGSQVTQYQLDVKKDNGSYSTAYSGSSRSYTYNASSNGTYTFRVRARNSAGWGAYSNTASSSVTSSNTGAGIDSIPDQVVTSLNGANLNSDLVGEIQATSSVDGGAFKYSVPITLPPGRKGMSPSVSLNYSSQNGAGVAGFGWSLAGSGAIHRCADIYDLESSAVSVQYNLYDKLCINGERLLATSGTYGYSGTKYQTERNPSFTVEQVGGHLNSDSVSFVVHYTNGNSAEYGSDANSRKKRSGHGVSESWMLHILEDTFGNQVEYEYTLTTGNSYLKNIYYTGLNGQRGNRVVSFVYTSIPTSYSYSYGGKSASNKLLQRIDVKINNVTVANWRLGHTTAVNDDIHDVKLLEELKYCEGSSSTECVATDFDWYEMDYDYSATSNHPLASVTDQFNVGQTVYREGDFDNDGVQDLHGAERIYLSSGGTLNYSSLPGFSTNYGDSDEDTPFAQQSDGYRYTSVQGVMDYDGDGNSDLIYKDSSSKIRIALMNKGVIKGTVNTNISAACSLSYVNVRTTPFCNNFILDFDGDGWKDLLVATKAVSANVYDSTITYKAYRNKGNSTGFNYAGEFQLDLRWALTPLDVNGDGLLDLAASSFGKAPYWYQTSYNRSTGRVSFTHKNHTLNVNYNEALRNKPGRWVDFNGDGLPDILTLHLKNSFDATYTYSVVINKGNGKFESPVSTGKQELAHVSSIHGGIVDENAVEGQVYTSFIKVFDFNGDGRQDLLIPTQKTANRYLCWDQDSNQACDAIDGAEFPRFHIYDVFEWDVWITQENGTSFVQHELGSGITGALATMSVVDVNGDGRDDFVSGIGFESDATHRRWRYGNPFFGNYPRGYVISQRDSTDNFAISEVSTGMGTEAKISYAQLADATVANDSFVLDLGHPYVRFTNTMRVVDEYSTDNGVGSFNTTFYEYGAPIFHLAGRGFQGFEKIVTTTSQAITKGAYATLDVQTTINFNYEFPWSGMVASTQTKDITHGYLLSETSNTLSSDDHTYSSGTPYCFYSPVSTQISYQQDGSEMSRTTTSTKKRLPSDASYPFCQPEEVVVTATDDYTTKTVTTDFEYYNSGYVSMLSDKTVKQQATYSLSGLPTGARSTKTVTHYTKYNSSNFAVTETGIKNSSGNVEQSTKYSYFNSYGIPERVTQGSRWLHNTYRSDGYFIESVSNRQWGLNVDATTYFYNDLTGIPEIQIDANGITTTTNTDFLGNVLSTSTTKNGVLLAPPVYTQRVWQSGSYAARIKTVQDGSPIVTAYLDSLGREVKSQSTGFSGALVTSQTIYDERGNIYQQVTPTSDYSTRTSVTYGEYDAWNRPSYKDVDDGFVRYTSTYTYDGLKTDILVNGTSLAQGSTASNIGSRTATVGNMSRIYNSMGQLLKTVDAKNGSTYFAYDGAGNPDYIKDAKGKTITAVYNDIGEKLSFNDPNMGQWTFTYNQYGELERQTDARNVQTVPVYDYLGRIKSVSGRSWTYDVAGYGLLDSTNSGTGQIKSYDYDAQLRVDHITTTIDNINFVQKYAYNATLGSLKGEEFPSGEVIGYEYNRYGFVEREYRLTSSGEQTLREISSLDAFGNIKQQIIGGDIHQTFYREDSGAVESICAGTSFSCTVKYQHISYDYDQMGNLVKQRNEQTGLEEQYVYDNLMRVQGARYTRGSTVLGNYNYDYDAVGNLTNKSDYATFYGYNSSKSGGGNAGPNAVRRITRASGGTVYFEYDNNGNMTKGDGLTQAIYNVDNKPTKIVKHSVTATFAYGEDGMRFKQTKTASGQTTTTYYIGKGFEREIQPGNHIVDKTYVGDHTTLYTTVSGSPDYPASVLHSLVDRLGSATTLLRGDQTNPSIIRHRAHGIFGRPIDAGTGGLLTSLASWDNFNRGYTGHEQLVEQKLIHMNGRVYDYNLGRFMSVDPVIQAPTNSQSMNPYSYIMNNPMAGVDPSGYTAETPTEIPQTATDTQQADLSNTKFSKIEKMDDGNVYGTTTSGEVYKLDKVTVSNGAGNTISTFTFDSSNGNGTANVGKPSKSQVTHEDGYTNYGGYRVNWRNVQQSILDGQGSVVSPKDLRENVPGDLLNLAMSDFEAFTDQALIAGMNSSSMERASMFGGSVDMATSAAVAGLALMRHHGSNVTSPTYRELAGLVKGFEAHHILPQYLGKQLGYTQKQMLDHPAILIPKFKHTGALNPDAYHKVINRYLPRNQTYTPQQIRGGLQRAYEDLGKPELYRSVEGLIK
ncbi:FG-GAP-like repeat-containing protein [Alteromonas sp. KUL49]|uniref:RHS repeat-associated core domain-containing protein n=1 Tax=Alteromonas sp. KUL49 TaxID=2480798 RepID=UPI00102F2A7E|nr:FG-GAP-like repeat-containing protein [Alteromonas sp. KUL49]TAP39215.1 hypothetical protein EYS00_11745 [Alteromonas sp. KUL49]GEA11991.1 hypothetical protein KUL49_23660 [Alteromonas sp. KUL49]